MGNFGQGNNFGSLMHKIKSGASTVIGKNFEGQTIYNQQYNSFFPLSSAGRTARRLGDDRQRVREAVRESINEKMKLMQSEKVFGTWGFLIWPKVKGEKFGGLTIYCQQ